MLMWTVTSWSLFLPMIVPANNTVLAVGFFMAFFGLLFSGGIAPVKYRDGIYGDSSAVELFCGFFSVTRFFMETLSVQEQRCLPEQSGFTVAATSVNFPLDIVGSFNLVGLAQNDESVVQQSCNGWYWGVLPGFMVGLTVRFLAAGTLHISDRAKQAKKSLWNDLKVRPLSRNPSLRALCLFLLCWISLFSLTSWLIVRTRGNTGILDSPTGAGEQIELADATLTETFA